MTRKRGESLLEELKREREELENDRVYQFLRKTGIGDMLLPLALLLALLAIVLGGLSLAW